MTTQITRQKYLLTTVSRQSPITCINTEWNIEIKKATERDFVN